MRDIEGALVIRQLSLLYHRVNELTPDPWTLCVSPAHFSEHLEVIKRLSLRPWVTFDDGYLDNLQHALPALERHGVQGRFFVASGALGLRTELWWDALDLLFPVYGDGYWQENESLSAAQADYLQQFHRLRQLPFEVQEQELEKLFAQRNLSRLARPERRMMSVDELRILASSPLAEIGAHTRTHPVLSGLSIRLQEEEIVGSKRELEEMIGARVEGFAYPNGTAADYTAATVDIVRRAGFCYAYSAYEHSLTDPFQLPRVMIRDWDGDEFERVLRTAARAFG